MELTIKSAGGIAVTRGGAEVTLKLGQVPEAMVQALFEHGVAAKVGDAAASATAQAVESHFGKAKKDVSQADWKAWVETPAGKASVAEFAQSAMEGVLAALYEGNWTQGRTGGPRVARLPDDQSLAVKTAKQDLLTLFKRITGKGKLVEMAEHEKIAPFFQEAGDGVAWLDQTVMEWIEKQRDEGKRDYIAEAKATLEVDVSALDL